MVKRPIVVSFFLAVQLFSARMLYANLFLVMHRKEVSLKHFQRASCLTSLVNC